MAPEQFTGELYDPYKADIFQLGVTLMKLIFKVQLFKKNSNEDPAIKG